ncbi:hypothetical protein [Calothrix sp. NIES-3974]|uniref:hypothetical protein n=1 Tax=Calothrix sp. NIES-3974 TaxID=2005462 RepID=UPI0018D4FA30|nr:hypothetical protein [Calothrix sp. NIES-3974]
MRSQQIGVTVINPGYVATPEVLADLAANNFFRGIHCVSHVVWRQPNQKVVPINGSS